MKRLTRAEWLLFVIPLIVVPAIWFVQTVRPPTPPPQPTPPPTPAPRPTPIPTPWLLTEREGIWEEILSSLDGKKIITGSNVSSSYVQVWDAKTLQPQRAFGEQPSSKPLALTPDGKRIIVGWGGKSRKHVLVYDLATGRQVLQMPYGTGTSQLALSPDGKVLALSFKEYLELRKLRTGRLLRRMRRWLPQPAASSAGSPSFSSDGRRIAFVDDLAQSPSFYASGKRDEIGLFSVRSGQRLRVLGWKQTDIRNLAFSPDGKFLAVVAWVWKQSGANVGAENRILLCDANTGRLQRTLPARKQMHALAFSPNGKYLAVGSYGEGVQVWNVREGKLHLEHRNPKIDDGGDSVSALHFMPDNRALLVGARKVKVLSIQLHSKS